jgi:predicted nucleotidyltransferase
MSNSSDKELLKIIAHALKELLPDVVFVGGITTFLYMGNENAPQPTATDDVDLILEVTSILEYEVLEKRLSKLGFKRNLSTPGPLCRFEFNDIKVDFMPIDPKILGFSNRWYEQGFKTSIDINVDDLSIKIFDLPYFFASKMEAFKSRGAKGALWESKDLEDIFTVLDTRSDAVEQIKKIDPSVSAFLKEEFDRLLMDESRVREAIESVLMPYGKGVKELRSLNVLSMLKKL